MLQVILNDFIGLENADAKSPSFTSHRAPARDPRRPGGLSTKAVPRPSRERHPVGTKTRPRVS
jgi:hypothetical protein